MKFFGFVLATAMILVNGCTSLDKSNSTIVVGVTPNFPPLVNKVDGEFVGFEVDLLKKIAADVDKNIVFKEYPFTGLYKALEEKEVDLVIGGISNTRKRSSKVSFTESVLVGGQMHIVRRDDYTYLAVPALIKRKKNIRIGVENRTTGDDYATAQFKNAKIIRYDSAETALWSLKKGNVDVVIHDAPTSWNCSDPALKPVFRQLTKEPYGWAYRKGEEARFSSISKALKKFKMAPAFQTMWKQWTPQVTTITFGK